MSRIFNDTYEKLVARVDRPERPRSNQAGKSGDDAFNRLLADLEKPSKSSGLKGKDVVDISAPAPKEAPLTNLSFREQVGTTGPAIADIAHATSALGPAKQPLRSVKEADGAVKTPSVTPAPALPPSAPELLYGGWKSEKRAPTPIRLGDAAIKNVITTAGKYHGVDPHLSMAVARAESSFNSEAVSQDGHESKGLFQLLDSTGKEMMQRLGMKEKYDPFDPAQNSFLGAGYLRRLHDLFSRSTDLTGSLSTHPASSAGDLEKLAVAAFNAGEGNVARAQQKALGLGKDPTRFDHIEAYLPAQTRAYVDRVMEYRLTSVSDKGISTKV